MYYSLGQETRVEEKWLDRTLPLFQHLRSLGTAIEYRKESRLGAPQRPELSSQARCRAAGPRSRGSPVAVPQPSSRTPADTAIEYRKKSRDCERGAATASLRDCTAGVQELQRMSRSSTMQLPDSGSQKPTRRPVVRVLDSLGSLSFSLSLSLSPSPSLCLSLLLPFSLCLSL